MPSPSLSRYRRRILGLGALATGALYVIGAPFYVDGIENDLERRVPAELAAAGHDGVAASFSGQDGSLTCSRPLDDPEGAIAAAYDVRGVRSVELDRSCRVNRVAGDAAPGGVAPTTTASDQLAATAPTTDTSDGDVAMPTIRDLVAANPDLAFLSVLLDELELDVDEPFTFLAPTNAAFDAVPADQLAVLQSDSDLLRRVLTHHAVPGLVYSADFVDGELATADGSFLTVATGDPVTIDGAELVEVDIEAHNAVVHLVDRLLLPDGVLLVDGTAAAPAALTWDGQSTVLSGVAASEVERQLLVAAAVEAFGLDAVVDQMTVDPDTGVARPTAERLATLVRAMPANLSSGEVGFNGDDVYATGAYRTEEGRDAFAAVATSVSVVPALSEQPRATADEAATLEAELNEFVGADPINFEPSSARPTGSAFAVIDQVAALLAARAGVRIVVEGHTDSDGLAAANLSLSQARAAAVRDELIARGIDADLIEAIGLGSTQPVLVDGIEDKAGSRRVQFRISVAEPT